ncbi:MAG: ABC transporter ATP-binding protein [Bacteroidetes bacterium]|jgi:Cu-processing system ATP-binding protein|nr:ABC transporter ATP-binding protein [Bacteroidota bacterium]MBK6820563.1 ABC transporter ATP-binding protein [Bacteroidota bacterium]MBK7040928.1 ABC transporter ATP-binding protein [Bacteroidota bacterium]MBK7587919.1 ABC transporter ATP-binding protein [Bacteroidota bacterium]MBK9482600.1 ABC transporter ATP-binding protein [Bacteroidota bacterium]
MIEVNAISKQFGKLEILKKVTMSLPAGECIALIGPNGCGKTTLIKCILGMVLPTSGTILFEGKPIDNEYLYRNKIGYMPQMGRYPDNMTIGQIIKMMKEIRKEEKTLDEELYEQYGLSKLLNKKMRTLSGGTIQKVSATLAFMFNPAVYILDEPTAGLDPIASEILKEKIIKEKEKGKLFLITSHLLSELDDLVTQLIFMQEGNILFQKPIAQLLDETGELKISKAVAHFLKRTQYA